MKNNVNIYLIKLDDCMKFIVVVCKMSLCSPLLYVCVFILIVSYHIV